MANISLQKQFENFKKNLGNKLQEAGFIVEGEMHKIVAIDTGKLNKSISTDDVIDHGNILSVDVGSRGVPYAVFVELGIGKIFNYHRPPPPGRNRQVVWVGNGQHWAQRSLEAKHNEIGSKLREARISQ